MDTMIVVVRFQCKSVGARRVVGDDKMACVSNLWLHFVCMSLITMCGVPHHGQRKKKRASGVLVGEYCETFVHGICVQ